jgi:hypothetical protein
LIPIKWGDYIGKYWLWISEKRNWIKI